ncbi:MAG: PP2C family protein-serine/threonine phosphatase [Tenuifilaceae bacterium]
MIKSDNFSIWGEFTDFNTENCFLEKSRKEIFKRNSLAILIAGIGFWFVALSDIAKLGWVPNTMLTTLLRTLFLILSVSLFFYFKKKLDFKRLNNLIFIFSLSCSTLIVSVIYLINPDKSIDLVDFMSVPLVLLLFYIFLLTPQKFLVINGMYVSLLYFGMLTIPFTTSLDTIIVLIAIFSAINFMGIFVNRFQNITKRKEYLQNEIINNLNLSLKQEVEERRTIQESLEKLYGQITDSINYAKKIQLTLLPPEKVFKSVFTDHFILFNPKDVVSGDFYWIFQHNRKVYIAVADCTGHGIPGAFVSMLGISFLNEISQTIVSGNKDISPSEVLEMLRRKMKLTLIQHEDLLKPKEGMDIAFCTIDMQDLEIEYSGAHNSLILIRDGDLKEFKADRQTIGESLKETPFTNHKFSLLKGDLIYLFSDGYYSQLGGLNGSITFKSRNFKELVSQISCLPLTQQREVLIEKHNSWRGKYNQIDDILVVGLKI